MTTEELKDAIVQAARELKQDVLGLANVEETPAARALAEQLMLRDVTKIVAAVDELETLERKGTT